MLLIVALSSCIAQVTSTSDTIPTSRKWTLGAGSIIAVSSSYFLLDQLWYKNYPRSSFHFFNDNDEWLQMDKAGHAFSSYTLGRHGYDAFKWSGMTENQRLWIGGNAGLIYLTGIELLDSKSDAWGFSIGDMIANTSGSFLFITQQKLWREQRITLKFSYSQTDFAMMNPEQLGRNFQQRLLKDYNGQTYWCSFNVHSFLAYDAAFPRFINVAFGYGATEMLHAKTNTFDVNNFQREREFYISFDADLTRVQWKRKWMMKTAKFLNFIKIPTPTLEIRSDGKVKMHTLFF